MSILAHERKAMSVLTHKHKECEGCQTIYVDKRCIGTVLDNCPCMNCLVKVMCEESCDDLLSHIKRAEEEWKNGKTEGSYHYIR